MSKKNEKGQSLIELLLSISLLGGPLIFIILYLYFLFAQMWIEYCVYESLVCIAEQKNTDECKNKLVVKVEEILPIGNIEYTKLKKYSFSKNDRYEGEVHFLINEDLRIKLKKKIEL